MELKPHFVENQNLRNSYKRNYESYIVPSNATFHMIINEMIEYKEGII